MFGRGSLTDCGDAVAVGAGYWDTKRGSIQWRFLIFVQSCSSSYRTPYKIVSSSVWIVYLVPCTLQNRLFGPRVASRNCREIRSALRCIIYDLSSAAARVRERVWASAAAAAAEMTFPEIRTAAAAAANDVVVLGCDGRD